MQSIGFVFLLVIYGAMLAGAVVFLVAVVRMSRSLAEMSRSFAEIAASMRNGTPRSDSVARE